jgi:SAM-dependent methyltransferase
MHLDKVEMFNYMREAFRVLAPGGKFYCDTYNVVAPDGWEQFLKIVEMYTADSRPGHVSQFSTPPEMLKFMTEAGFVDIEVDDRNLTLVVSLGKKPEQEGFQRPDSASNEETIARTQAEIKRRLDYAEKIAEEIRRRGFAVEGDRAILEYDKWIELSNHVEAKDAYIAQLEAILSKKDSHIGTLEKRVRKMERRMRPLPVRVAMRLSKPK